MPKSCQRLGSRHHPFRSHRKVVGKVTCLFDASVLAVRNSCCVCGLPSTLRALLHTSAAATTGESLQLCPNHSTRCCCCRWYCSGWSQYSGSTEVYAWAPSSEVEAHGVVGLNPRALACSTTEEVSSNPSPVFAFHPFHPFVSIMCRLATFIVFHLSFLYNTLIVVWSLWIFTAERVVGYNLLKPAAPERHPTARGRTTFPRPPLTAALCVPGDTTGANGKLGERRASKGGLPGVANT